MILLLGGTGTLGRKLLPSLVSDGSSVRVLARRVPAEEPVLPPGTVEYLAGDVRDRASLARAMSGVDTVVSAVTGFAGRDPLGSGAVDRDGNLRAIDAARTAGVGHFILMSIHDAGPHHPIQLNRDKWTAEEALRASGLEWSILRPTPFVEPWLELIGRPLVEKGTTRVFGRGRNPINLVSALDVAGFVRLAIADPALRGTATEVPGPENLTLDELVALVRVASGHDGRVQHVPRAAMHVARAVTRLIAPGVSALIAAALAMDGLDMTVDGTRLRSAHPSVPMTTAAEVAQRMFGPATVAVEASGA